MTSILCLILFIPHQLLLQKKIKLEPSIGLISNSKLQVQDEDNFYDRFLLEHSSYDWLYIHEKAMHCRDCDALYAPESTKYRFAGSKNFQNSTLKTHHNSTSHEIAVKHNKPTQQKFISDIKTWTSCLPETPEDKHLQLLKKYVLPGETQYLSMSLRNIESAS